MTKNLMYDREIHAILDALKIAFDRETFSKAYPGVEAPQAVTIGGDASELAFEVYIQPFPSSIQNERRIACPGITTEFTISVAVVVTGTTIEETISSCYAYVDCVHQVFLADPSLGGDIGSVSPQLDAGGVGYDGTYGYKASAAIELRITRDWDQNIFIKRAIQQAR